MKSHHDSFTDNFTNIRPSHYFISMPRHSVSYIKSTPAQDSTVFKPNSNPRKPQTSQVQRLRDYITHNTQIGGWMDMKPKAQGQARSQKPKGAQNSASKVVLPSSRRKENCELQKTLRNFQELRRSVFDQQRKTNFMNNRWRESMKGVINSMDGPIQSHNKSQRAIPGHKYESRHKKQLKKIMRNFLQNCIETDMQWKRKKRVGVNKVDTFKRIQKVKHDGKGPITLRGDRFCFKK